MKSLKLILIAGHDDYTVDKGWSDGTTVKAASKEYQTIQFLN